MSDLTNRIDKLLSDRHLKRADMVRATGIPASTIRRWIVSDSSPSADNIYKVAQFFGVTIEFLLTGADSSSSENNEIAYHLNLTEQELIDIYRKINPEDKEMLYQLARKLEMPYLMNSKQETPLDV